MNFRLPILPQLIFGSICLAAAVGCSPQYVKDSRVLKQWKAEPASCVRATADDEIVVQPGRLVAKDFTWANSEIEFSLYDPGNASFTLYFYDRNYEPVRRKYADKWFEREGGRTIPLSESDNLWKVDRVHAMGLGGDNELYERGYRAFGGQVTAKLDVEGIPKDQRVVIFSENFKVGQWNHILIHIEDGLMTVSVNGKAGQKVQTNPKLNGRIEFEVDAGSIRLKNIACRQLSEEEEQCNEQQEHSQL